MTMLTLWSAGNNGGIAKRFIGCGVLIMALWITCIITFLTCDACFKVNGQEVGIIGSIVMVIFFGAVTFFIPLISINMIKRSRQALKRNKKFYLRIIESPERFECNNIDISKIVFGDKDGIVITNDKEAYDDWAFFYKIDSLRDFYDAKNKLEVEAKL